MTLKKAFGKEKAHKNLTLGVQVQWKGDDDELRERESHKTTLCRRNLIHGCRLKKAP